MGLFDFVGDFFGGGNDAPAAPSTTSNIPQTTNVTASVTSNPTLNSNVSVSVDMIPVAKALESASIRQSEIAERGLKSSETIALLQFADSQENRKLQAAMANQSAINTKLSNEAKQTATTKSITWIAVIGLVALFFMVRK